MSSIRLIKQTDETGCGIACVAMITDRKYKEIKDLLMAQEGWKKPDRKLYTRVNQLTQLLNNLGVSSKKKKSKSFEEISGVSIVGIDRQNGGYFHWVIVIKDSHRFIIIDPEYGEVVQGHKAKKKKYRHGPGTSNYISISKTIDAIRI